MQLLVVCIKYCNSRYLAKKKQLSACSITFCHQLLPSKDIIISSEKSVLVTEKKAWGGFMIPHPAGLLRCPEPGHLWSTEQCPSS